MSFLTSSFGSNLLRVSLAGVATMMVVACGTDAASDEEFADDPTWDLTGDELRVGASCDASRANNTVTHYEDAFLDMIAHAEGTRGWGGADGYNVMYGHRTVSDCTRHPNRNYCSGGLCSTAAGRYQFLYKTWKTLKLPTFKPENQTRGAITLIKRRKAVLPNDKVMTATEFKNVLDKISYEWASLPPGRYGQPMKSLSDLRELYCTELDCSS